MLVSGVKPWWRWYLHLTEGGNVIIMMVPVAPFVAIGRCVCSVVAMITRIITMIARIITMVTRVVALIARIIAMVALVALSESTILIGVVTPGIGWSFPLLDCSIMRSKSQF